MPVLKKKILKISVFFAFIIFFSCSNSNQTNLMTFEEVTLRNKTIDKDDRLDWSTAIDPSALRDTERRYGSREKPTEYFYPDMGIAIGISPSPVFPGYNGFGSLDVSDVNEKLYNQLTSFLNNLMNADFSQNSAFFKEKYLEVVFNYQWKNIQNITAWKIGKPFVFNSDEKSFYEISVLIISEESSIVCTLFIDYGKAAEGTLLIEQADFRKIK